MYFQASEQKDFVVLIFPTPSLKEITGGEKLAVDGDWWVEEHSKQVLQICQSVLYSSIEFF